MQYMYYIYILLPCHYSLGISTIVLYLEAVEPYP